MRLKSLTIKGFKSFANETVINFNEDVIGIVGPNGSGKSNVVDAVRWVLGEQKGKELRLDKMSNLIFNGTKKKKQGGMAMVSLTFENTKNLLPTEYHTVTITRILYRSGESEYRLNNVTCRLKDITTLFMDTGVGSNSYAIIALGMVDDLLNDKNNSRRKMFEQASGISKYKKRKHETLNKLKNTTEDLDRIEDLLFEIEGNLKQLEKQAKRAKRFYDLKNNYKLFSIELANYKLKGHKGRHEELTSSLTREEDNLRAMEVRIHKLEATLETEKKTNLDKEKELSEKQRAVNSLVGHVRGMENDKKILEQKRGFIDQNQVKLSEQINTFRSRIQDLTNVIDELRMQLSEEKRAEAGLEAELDVEEKKLEEIRGSHGSLKEELDDYIQEQQTLERSVFELEKNKAINTSKIENLVQERDESHMSIEGKGGEVAALEVQLTAINGQIETVGKVVNDLENAEAQRQEEIVQTEDQIETIRKEIADVNRKLDAKRNEYKLTKSMVENLEGFPESIKFLSKNNKWSENAPLLSDVMYCNEAYRVAIENYLEPYLNYYVVKTVKEAYAAIQLLSSSQKGKANFFILDAFKDYMPPSPMMAGAQPATNFIETDAPYNRLISYLLENVMITESDDIAKSLSNNDVILLSKSGRMVQRRFSLSGGSVGLFEGKKIGRKKNLEVLEQEIGKLEKDETKLSSKFYSLRTQLENLKSKISNDQINTEREKLNKLSQEKVSFLTRLENFENILRDARTKHELAVTQSDHLTKENRRIEQDLKAKLEAVEKAKSEISEKDGSFRKIADELSVASSAYNNKNIEFIRQQNKVNTSQRELSFNEKTLEETKINLNSNEQTIELEKAEMLQIDKDVERMEQELLLKYDEKKEKEANLSMAEQGYFQARGGINEIDDELRQLNRQRQSTVMLIQNLKDRFNEFKLDTSSIAERLKIEFNITVEEVMEREPSGKFTEEELQEKVVRMKARLDNYGEINPMAVEAYDEMKERYDTIVAQKEDILNAKKSLLETIKEIEESAVAQFMESFDKVRTYFIDAFRTLFTEDDQCDLVLEEPDNPLESKIKIIAKPKGKRPVTINQLSGGEKTLTATALLFALYLLKPAPFCIFDEVDAPLDDQNIEKFNKIIRKFSKDSQFIIVTHNKQTMAAVDVIYGVYMAEQGVSAVANVDFRELDDSSTLETAFREG